MTLGDGWRYEALVLGLGLDHQIAKEPVAKCSLSIRTFIVIHLGARKTAAHYACKRFGR